MKCNSLQTTAMPKKPTPRKVTRTAAPTTPETVAKLNVERKKITALKPHPKNPRKHPKSGSPGWEVLKKSLEHDYFDPLVWNSRNGLLVSGHLRRKVFTEMGVKEADVVVVDYDEPTHLARMIAANKGIGEDDAGLLAKVFHELGAIEDFDFSLAGFTLEGVEALAEIMDGEDSDLTDEERDATSSEDRAKLDSRIQELLVSLGNPEFPVDAGDTYVVGKQVVVLCAFDSDKLPFAILRWLSSPLSKSDAAWLGPNAKRKVRVVTGPEAFLLVDDALDRWTANRRWLLICPTVVSAQTLLAVSKSANPTLKIVKVA